MIHLTNTLSGKKEYFNAQKTDKKILMYVCGITPYGESHIGHGRAYITFDVLYRLLKFLGFDVRYCRNFTDIDDKLIKKAQDQFADPLKYPEVAQKYITMFHEDMRRLNCLSPTIEPRVTEHMDQIIVFIQKLIDAGHAYAVNGDVYFSLSSIDAYAKLSKHKLEDLRAGARIDVREDKKDPLDFALWKSECEGTFFKSPWGWGRPGWHIECSVLASEYLGEHIDIHGGGMDLIFPHHDNEIAQSEALFGAPFSRFWVHNGLVQLDKEKMSKSLGNVLLLSEIFKKFDPMVVRFYMLNHQYRAPLDFSFESLVSIQKSYERLIRAFSVCHSMSGKAVTYKDLPIVQKMLEFLCDDLNTVGMLGVVFENLSVISQDIPTLCAVKAILQNVLGLTLEPLEKQEAKITPEIKKLIDEREHAREQKNWARADELLSLIHI